MAVEIVTHGINWINEGGVKLKCPECGKKRSTKEITQENDLLTATFTCALCKCIYKLEREIV